MPVRGVAVLAMLGVAGVSLGTSRAEVPAECSPVVPGLAEARRADALKFELRGCAVTIQRGQALVSEPEHPRVELAPDQVRRLAAVFENIDAYSDCSGMIACTCNEIILDVTCATKAWQSIYCSSCVNVMPRGVGIHAALSATGRGLLDEFFAAALKEVPKPAEAD